MAISRQLGDREYQKFRESTTTSGQVGVVVVNPDGSNIGGGAGGGLTDAQLRATPVPVSGTVTATPTGTQDVQGNVAHDAVDSGNPVKVGGKANSSAQTAVADGDRVDANFDLFGDQKTILFSPELNNSVANTSLRDLMVAQRYTVLADSLADGLATFWTSTTANGGTATSTGGEGVLQTSASATGSAQLTSTTIPYLPGQSAWLNSAVRFNDTGSAGNIRRLGVFTISGTTPQEGFYFELSGTTLNAVVVKAGTPTAVASTSWSRVASAPFTLTTNYHSFEIRFTANSVQFYVDNVIRHIHTGTTSAITTTLNFPITLQSINTSGATNRSINVRNIGYGRFGERPPIASSVVAFQTDIPTAGTRVRLASNVLTVGAIIQAPSTNTGNVYVGDITVSSTVKGAELQPGQATSVGVFNTNLIYVDTDVSGSDVMVLGS